MKSRYSLKVFLLALAQLIVPVIAVACPVCLTGAGSNDPVAKAFNWSVLFLMATPYTVVGGIAGWLVYSYRRAAAKRAEEEHEEASGSLDLVGKETGR